MQTVVLDTNALLMPFEIRINLDLALRDLLGDTRIVVPGPLVGELKHLDHRFAKAAIALARKYEIIPTEYIVNSLQWSFNKEESRRPQFYDPQSPYFGKEVRQVYHVGE